MAKLQQRKPMIDISVGVDRERILVDRIVLWTVKPLFTEINDYQNVCGL
ncbi:hypothetical protein J2T20_002725 [Paenibacillus wynnii]|nr:hypothetical protein [Paenibacillus wynnii]